MKIGVFADSHDNLPKIEKAVRIFNRNKVGFVLHAGDFIAPFAISKLKTLSCDWSGVFGNNDGERDGLSHISEGKIKRSPLRLELADRKITLSHDINTVDLRKEDASVIIFGHTHKPQVITKDRSLLINPGECGGWLTNKSTIAIIDLVSLTAQILGI